MFVFEPDEKPLSLLRRAGVGSEWICSLRDLPRQQGEHILAHAARLAAQTPAALTLSPGSPRSLSAPLPDSRPSITEDDRRDCHDWLARKGLEAAPLVLIQAGNKKTMKGGNRRRATNVDYWPEERWARVIEGVCVALPDARVVLCGSPSERELAEDVATQVNGLRERVVIATDDLPIVRLLALQARAHSLISVNTGPAHSAAAMGCPLVVMFTRHAHRAADLYAPVPTTGPVTIVQPEASNPDPTLATIAPERVLQAWRELALR